MPTADGPDLRPGSRWRSAVCESEVIVVRAPAEPVQLCIGGAPAIAADSNQPPGAGRSTVGPPDQSLADGTLLGKRYADEASGLELLCTRAGAGTITVAGRRAAIMPPRKLPASD